LRHGALVANPVRAALVPMSNSTPTARSPWAWIPTLYFAQGLPNVLVTSVSVILYKNLGIPNDQIIFYTSWLNLPWVIKPLWSPVVEILKTRRIWIWMMQLLVGAGLASIALTIPTTSFFQLSLLIFFLIAFSSATHDIAADGFYMMALPENKQVFFVGIRSTFFRLAMIAGQGLIVIIAGAIIRQTDNVVLAWSWTFGVTAGLLIALAVYHLLVLPQTERHGKSPVAQPAFFRKFFETFASFFRKPGIGIFLAFLLLYRFAEVQLAKPAQLFLLESRGNGGLGLATGQVGFLYGTIGVIALLVGGILGGILASRNGLRAWIWPMALAINIPDAVFVYLSYSQPEYFAVIGSCVAVEQFGYGFGFAAYMLYMIYISRGEHQTAHYAICTGFMALGKMLPEMWSGDLLKWLGYQHFFIWVMIATVPSFLVLRWIPLDADFGRKK
jgi:PAT family beta-lactamase induction signal transducer AmpG